MKKITLPKLNFNFSLPGFRKQKLALGLDIGSYAVKICELTSSQNGCRLLKLGSAKLPEGAVEDGVLQDPDSVGAIITTLINNLKIKNKKVAISISGYSVIVKKINLAVMSAAELEEHIQAEAEQYIPFDIDDVFLDFQDLKTNSDESDRTDIMLVAAKKDVINTYLRMLEKIGLQAVVVDVDAFALENSYENVESLAENVALIDIGASKMSFNIIANGASILARDVVMGSRQITEQIQNRLGMDAESAEAAKIGLLEVDPDHREKISEIFINTCTQWVLEIKKALDFYISSYPDDNITNLILSGGGAKINGFATLLREETGIQVNIFDPFANAESDTAKLDPAYLKHIAPEMAIAAGLAIRKIEL
nr:type IV pilus assembly protein PilM [Desulfobulbaceae bacterium]